MGRTGRLAIVVAMMLALRAPGAWADDQIVQTTQPQGRYFFGLLDGRSSLGKDFFPDPFIGPDFDVETQLELDYFHAEKRNVQNDQVDGDFQWNPFGQLTLSAELGWERQSQSSSGSTQSDDPSGLEDVDLSIYHPLLQFVSQDRVFDYTLVGRFDIGIPTRTAISGTDPQLTPYLGQMLRIGNHFSVQGWAGGQWTLGPDMPQDNALIYGLLLGWRIRHDELPAPLIESITPVLELDGVRPFSAAGGQDALSGIAGVNLDFPAIGAARPALSFGWQFPIDQGARDHFRWGIATEIFLEF
jgi:hypothetical protein